MLHTCKKIKGMKKIYSIAIGLIILSVTLVSCEGLLGTDSDQILLPSEVDLSSPDKDFYSINGILNELELLSQQYVLLGELRGDLMETTSFSDEELREIYNFDISSDNKFNDSRAYYSVINLCNYLIANVDTAIIIQGEKVNYRDYVAAKSIRAWTYMQLALNYGEAKYFEEPILDVTDANSGYKVYTFDELAPVLIDDLSPWKSIEKPEAFSSYMYFDVRMLLGDLYLWTGQYENAAREYYDLIDDEMYYIHPRYVNKYDGEDEGIIDEDTYSPWNWDINLYGNSFNTITKLIASVEYKEDGSPLDSLNSYYMNQLAPSDVAINNWETQTYYQTATVTIEGDLRGGIRAYGSYVPAELYENSSLYNIEKGRIMKFAFMNGTSYRSLVLYRSAHLYLKFAEALNRLEKPNMAFAVLKNGLGPLTMANDNLIPRDEKYISYDETSYTFYPYTNFSESKWIGTFIDEDQNTYSAQYNIGIHGRGCGNIETSTTFIIPELETMQDSMDYVEDKIIEEFALETAFEGNRFHDLMRIAKRRGDNAYLADKVAEKYDNKEAIRAKLMDENNWYLQSK